MLLKGMRLLAMLTAAAIAVVLAVHLGSQAPKPGRVLSWPMASSSAAPAPTASPPHASLLPQASTHPAANDPLSALRAPLSTVFDHLNADTKATAAGQYAILQELSQALRNRIDGFLKWIADKH
jgi:muramidase (phage lysozyme)